MPRPTSQDLAGFWDLLQLSIDDVTMKFDQLQQIKNNNWRLVDSPEKKVRVSVSLTSGGLQLELHLEQDGSFRAGGGRLLCAASVHGFCLCGPAFRE